MNTKQTKTQILSLRTLTVILVALPSAGFAESQWIQKADMPTPRRAFTASVVDGRIYVIGGSSTTGNRQLLNSVYMYDPSTDTWTRKADNPTPRRGHSAGVVDGKIYVMGGYPGSGNVNGSTTTFLVYDPATDIWTRKADMPHPTRGDHWSAVVDGEIYVFGGFCSECAVPGLLLSTVSAYDPVTDTWTQKADMPFAWAHPMSGAVDGKIYVCTGFGGNGDPQDWEGFTTLAVYDPVTDTWAEKADLPISRNDCATAVAGGKLYVMGGAISHVRIPDVIVYDPATDAWMDAPPLSRPTRGQRACTIGGTIYSIGGDWATNDGTPIISRMVEALDLNPAVDFNSDGAVDIDDLLILIESWGMDDPLVDIGPMPWGDGIVNSRDLLVFAEQMVEYDMESDPG